MKYTKKQFFSDVKAEADAIKDNARMSEKLLLSMEDFNPHYFDKCIYGLMAGGDCRNRRAKNLIKKCCLRYIHNDKDGTFTSVGFDKVKKNVNGETARLDSDYSYLSAIETYILLPEAKNENLIAYIKGETNKLIL